MIALAESAPPAVACDAIQVLGRRGARVSVPLFARLSALDEDNVALAAIEALGRIGGVETVGALIGAVERQDFFRTFPAIEALGRTGDARAVPSLERLLAVHVYAAEAARALGRTGQETAIAPLGALLSSPDTTLVRAAALALADLRERFEERSGTTRSSAGCSSTAPLQVSRARA